MLMLCLSLQIDRLALLSVQRSNFQEDLQRRLLDDDDGSTIPSGHVCVYEILTMLLGNNYSYGVHTPYVPRV